MKTPDALQALAALSHATRLEVFRLLVREGAIGLPAGQIAERLEVAPSTLSPHLAQLERAGLVTSSRDERRIFYAVNIEGMRALLAYLTEECCGGHPEICGSQPRPAMSGDAAACASRVPDATVDVTSQKGTQGEAGYGAAMFNVLFVCTGNSARSIMAECAMNRWGLGKFRGYSAGSTPKGQIHPMAIDVLRRLNYHTDSLRSKDWTEFAEGAGGPPLDFVFTSATRPPARSARRGPASR